MNKIQNFIKIIDQKSINNVGPKSYTLPNAKIVPTPTPEPTPFVVDCNCDISLVSVTFDSSGCHANFISGSEFKIKEVCGRGFLSCSGKIYTNESIGVYPYEKLVPISNASNWKHMYIGPSPQGSGSEVHFVNSNNYIFSFANSKSKQLVLVGLIDPSYKIKKIVNGYAICEDGLTYVVQKFTTSIGNYAYYLLKFEYVLDFINSGDVTCGIRNDGVAGILRDNNFIPFLGTLNRNITFARGVRNNCVFINNKKELLYAYLDDDLKKLPGPMEMLDSSNNWESADCQSDRSCNYPYDGKIWAIDNEGTLYNFASDGGGIMFPGKNNSIEKNNRKVFCSRGFKTYLIRNYNCPTSTPTPNPSLPPTKTPTPTPICEPGSRWTARENVRSWNSIASSHDGNKIIASLFSGQLYVSSDGGLSWTPRGRNTNWSSVACSADGNKLFATHGSSFGRIYVSDNFGINWTARGNAEWWSSISCSNDGLKLVACGRRNFTYKSGGLHTSTDGGVTWTQRELVRNWVSVSSSGDGNNLIAAVGRMDSPEESYPGQLFVSSNSGVTWNDISNASGLTSDITWVSVASSDNGSILYAASGREARGPEDSGVSIVKGFIYKSTNYGSTWTITSAGNRMWSSVSCSKDGLKVIATEYGDDTGISSVHTSLDGGITWKKRIQQPLLSLKKCTCSGDGNRFFALGDKIYLSDCSTPTLTPLVTAGKLFAWGSNEYGQLGDGGLEKKSQPIQIGSANNWIKVSTGEYHSLAINSSNQLFSWGLNDRGQLGIGSQINSSTPIRVTTPPGAIWTDLAKSSNGKHSAAITRKGLLYTWGENDFGQLGHETNISVATPKLVGLSNDLWFKVACGKYFTLAIDILGQLWAWGANDRGQLGTGDFYPSNKPIKIGTNSDWVDIAAGDSHSFAINRYGYLFAWGANDNGQFGNGTLIDSKIPIQIGTLDDWIYVACGADHTLALNSYGVLSASGSGIFGQIGDDKASRRVNFVKITNSTIWNKIACGHNSSHASRTNGKFLSWGENSSGQLGDSTNTQKNSPFIIGDLDVIDLSASKHVLAISNYLSMAPTPTPTPTPTPAPTPSPESCVEGIYISFNSVGSFTYARCDNTISNIRIKNPTSIIINECIKLNSIRFDVLKPPSSGSSQSDNFVILDYGKIC